MALFGRRAGGSAADWTPVAIRIVRARRPHDHREGMSSTAFDALVDMIGDARGIPYSFELEVRPPTGAPYPLEHKEKVPMSVVAPGLSSEQKIPDGIDVSGWARIDDPTTVAIDWTSYKSTPEGVAAVVDAKQVEDDRIYAQHVLAKAKPKMQEKLRASAWTSVSLLADAVRQGATTREQWEKSAQINLRRTLITQEQYDAARAIFEP